MARIAGVDLPKNKRGEGIGLTYIYGIGPSTAKYILGKAGIDVSKKVNQWDDEELNAIRNMINNEFKVEGQLRSEVQIEYQAFARYRLLSRSSPSQGVACSWTAHRHQQPYKEGQDVRRLLVRRKLLRNN